MDSKPPIVPVVGVADVPLEAGYTVGEYVIEGQIGEGGFGSVFKASHPLIGKVVAIKVLHRRYSAQPDMVSRFIAEARAVNQIRHRHIIDIFAFGQIEDGRHYYIMEYLDGLSLEEYILRRGRMDLGEAIPILRALARALDATHAKGIAHRDLKPDNVFMVADGEGGFEPRLLDFGIAKLLYEDAAQEHKTRTGAPMGTPQYMSPEQCRGRDVDHRTDIYGFGIMAYRMLTGTLPFDGGDYMDILLAQISEEPAAPSSLVPSLPPAVDSVIGWMLRKEPGERPPNLITAVRGLEDAAAALGIAVAPPSTSAVHISLTTPVPMQHTPPVIRSLFGAPGASMRAPSLVGAAPHITPLSPRARSRGVGRKLLMLALGLAGAVAAGLVVHWALSSARGQEMAGQAGQASALQHAASATNDSATAHAAPGTAIDPALGAGAQERSTGHGAGSPDDPPATAPQRASEEEPRFVTLAIAGTPKGTEVYGPQGLLGIAPGEIQLLRGEEPILLTFKADAHHPKSRQVVPLEDGSIEVKLIRRKGRRGRIQPVRKRAPPRTERPRDTLEDPFD